MIRYSYLFAVPVLCATAIVFAPSGTAHPDRVAVTVQAHPETSQTPVETTTEPAPVPEVSTPEPAPFPATPTVVAVPDNPAPYSPADDVPTTPIPAATSLCVIRSAGDQTTVAWAVTGVSTLPRGTVFTFTVGDQSVPLTSKAGRTWIPGYGMFGTYGVDDGTNIFGTNSQEIIFASPSSHATVTFDGRLVCEA